LRADDPVSGFLVANGWGNGLRAPLAGDASARRYERLSHAGRSAILMIVPTGLDTRPFLAVTGWLRGGGFSAPEILAADPDQGLVLLEDLGNDLLLRLCERTPELESRLYEAAVDVLLEIHRRPPPTGEFGFAPPPYDFQILRREACLAFEWYLPASRREMASDALFAELEQHLRAGLDRFAAGPAVAVYRDYHAENLIWLPDRPGRARIGLLDYQDMLLGHPAYDLVSLTEDARRDVAASLRDAMIGRYVERSGADPETFRYAAAFLSAQRNLKILGLFTRLCRRDAKPRYLAYLPRVWNYLLGDLSHPDLAPLRAWVTGHLPAPDRGILAAIAEGRT
jgi:N-acetylmuramate 1-kinase